MPSPKLSDDGNSVVLDLHGLTVDSALEIFINTVKIASTRGRSSIKVIHGSSTSNPLFRNRTIKNEIESLLASKSLDPFVTDFWIAQDQTLISLGIQATKDPRLINLSDVV